MLTTKITLARGVPETLGPELAKRLFFISSSIDAFELHQRDGVVDAVALAVSSPGPTLEELADKINRVVERDILPHRVLPSRVLWRSTGPPPAVRDVFDDLVRSGVAYEAGEGQVAFGQPLIALADWFDARLRAIATSLDDAVEYRYPTLLPTAALERFGYFASFPQFVMFVTRLHNDVDTYDDFVADFEADGIVTAGMFAQCHNHDYCLPPTMCYHTYHQHSGQQLERDCVVTSNGKAFRYESKYCSRLERLWDFTIREIVFMGSAEFALGCRTSVMAQTFELMDEIGLSGRCEVSNDPFFAGPDTAAKVFSQRLMELKYELVLETAPGKMTAAGSFNFHGAFFGEAFGITRADGDPIASGCVGVGLERLVYAFLCQHGLDERRWPAAVRTALAT